MVLPLSVGSYADGQILNAGSLNSNQITDLRTLYFSHFDEGSVMFSYFWKGVPSNTDTNILRDSTIYLSGNTVNNRQVSLTGDPTPNILPGTNQVYFLETRTKCTTTQLRQFGFGFHASGGTAAIAYDGIGFEYGPFNFTHIVGGSIATILRSGDTVIASGYFTPTNITSYQDYKIEVGSEYAKFYENNVLKSTLSHSYLQNSNYGSTRKGIIPNFFIIGSPGTIVSNTANVEYIRLWSQDI